MWNPQKAGYLLRNILGSKVVKTNLKGLPYQLFCYQQQEKPVNTVAEAVREAVDENDGKRDLAVDGSWQKRGFPSKNGLVTVTSVDTGKVIDVEVFQNIVFVRTKTKHLQNCKKF
ncbi:hypothetical protein TNCV_1673351 [Trichonephila clavipes]|nr:hypothetical protein TNCV_1673351 [Trichonephila clavipes]